MFIDSHCHLNFPELATELDNFLAQMKQNQVSHALCVSVNLDSFPEVLQIAEQHNNIYASVGVHPDYPLEVEPSLEQLLGLAQHPKVIAIGETGLDYFRLQGDLEWQRERFRTHIRAALQSRKPLIIHNRNATEDTLKIMRDEEAGQIGGVFHCFTENLGVAETVIQMGFYISFSGIVTFKNATEIKIAAQHIPLDRILIETDSPYLAPTPHRGKLNHPAYVKHVAEEIARLRNISVEEVGTASSENFKRLFSIHLDSPNDKPIQPFVA